MNEPAQPPLARRALAELVGTMGLVTAVVGSGIAAERLSPSDVGLQLLENAVATGAALFVLISVLAPVSGAQLNPVVTGVDATSGRRGVGDVSWYVVAQCVGAVLGALLANLMFGDPALGPSSTDRLEPALLLGEVVATAGLVAVVFGLVRAGRARLVAPAVAAYITGAYFFTSSTSFANPAVTLGRVFTDSFSGIAPGSLLPFVGAQVVGAVVGAVLVRMLWPEEHEEAPEDVVMEETA